MDIPLPQSFSNLGRTSDAASKRATKVHVHKKMILQPWDGLDLVEQILAEAKGSNKGNAREQLALSSPRVNPVMEDKAVAEGTTHAISAFLQSTAQQIPNLPAAAKHDLYENGSCDSDVEHMTQSFRKKKNKSASQKPSPCFLTGERPGPGIGLRAPSVGKYQPKFAVVERRAPTPVISKLQRRVRRPARSDHHTISSPLGHSLTGTNTLITNASFPSAPQSPHRAGTPFTPHEAYRKHEVRNVSSAFLSKTQRSEMAKSLDLSYWPLPTNGSVMANAGVFRGNARERAYSPFGCPQGTKADYEVLNVSRPQSVDFSRIVPRETHKTRLTYPTEDTTNLSYNPDDRKRSEHKESRAHYSIGKQVPNPRPQPPAPGDGLDPYANSLLTSQKKGFVDIRRMVCRATAYAADEDMGAPERLHPDYSMTERHGPVVAIPRTGRNSPGPGRGTPVVQDISYDVHDSSVRRHRPTCVIPRSERNTFQVRPTCDREEPYQVQDASHVVSVEFGKQISRDIRDKRFEFK